MFLEKKAQIFLAVAEAKSFSKAAILMSLSQSVISFHIDTLEKELGVSLFTRKGKSIDLTMEGEKLFSELKKIALQTRNLEESFIGFKNEIHNRIELAGDSFIFAFTLPRALHEFRKSNNNVMFSYKHLDQEELIDKILNDEIDIGLVGQPVSHRKIESEVCFEDSILLICANDKDCVKKGEITLDQIKNIPLLWAIGDKGLELTLTKGLSASGIKPKDLDIFMEVEDLPIMRNFIQAGEGAAFLPGLAVYDKLKSNTFRIIKIKDFQLTRKTYVIFKKKKHPRDIIVQFFNFIKETQIKNLEYINYLINKK